MSDEIIREAERRDDLNARYSDWYDDHKWDNLSIWIDEYKEQEFAQFCWKNFSCQLDDDGGFDTIQKNFEKWGEKFLKSNKTIEKEFDDFMQSQYEVSCDRTSYDEE